MAKRKATRRTRKPARKTTSRSRKVAAKSPKRAKVSRAVRKSARAGRKRAPAKKAAPRRPAKSSASRPARKSKARARTEARPAPSALNRERRLLRDDETMASAPSTLGYSPKASGAESGHQMYNQRLREHTEGGPRLTSGDVDADWNEAYSSGEETPGGDMPTPDQDVVEEIGRALGVEYDDAEELKGAPKIEERDRHRWEYDPASSEDYKDRNRRDED